MRHVLLIAGFYAAINVAILAGIGLTMGYPDSRRIHIADEERLLRMTPEDMGLAVVLDSGLMASGDRPRLVVLGASGAMRAFPPDLVHARLPEYEVSNLAVPAALMTDVLDIFDEVLVAVPPAVLRRSVLVLGITSMSFWSQAFPFRTATEPRTAWWAAPRPWTLVSRAVARSPALLDTRHAVRWMLPRPLVLAAKQRFRCWWRLTTILPPHPGDWLSQRNFWRLRMPAMQPPPGPRAAETAKSETNTPAGKRMERYLSMAGRYGGPYDSRQIDAFSTLIRRATVSGMRVVVVDMPLHSEHLAYRSHFQPFKERLAEAVACANTAARDDDGWVRLLDLSDAVADEYFADLAHASKDSRQVWVDILADRLRPLLFDRTPLGDD